MVRRIKNIGHFLLALTSCIFYGFPGKKLTVIAVTGTDGKTTTSHLLYEIIKNSGKKVSLISTISAHIGDKTYDTGFHVTTPKPWQLQKLITKAVRSGSQYLVLEVTSHSLDQFRTWGASIDISVITNISHEHLDYHKNFENYRSAKARILKGAKYCVLNIDDKNYNYLKQKTMGKVVTFGFAGSADISPRQFPIHSRLLGTFNRYNELAAIAVSKILEIDNQSIIKTLSSFMGIPGRMERIDNNKGITVYIDFAHKPNALKQTLLTARELVKEKLIVVFGCAGLRDKLKRPMMGEIASQLADCVILTSEDPRTEDVRIIIDEIAQGCLKEGAIERQRYKKKSIPLASSKHYFWKIADRQEAINFAIKSLAQKKDLVLLLGKGHEQSMCYGKVEYPWDEKKAAQKALNDKS